MALCTVTGTIYLPNGETAKSVTILFSRVDKSIAAEYLGAVIPENVMTATNRFGGVDVDLLTGNYIMHVDDFVGGVTVPDALTANIADILFLTSGTGVEIPAWLEQALAARDVAVEAAIEAGIARDEAVEAATPYDDGPLTARVEALEDEPAVTWDTLTNKPSMFVPAAHTHAIEQVVGLQDALDNAGITSIAWADVTDKPTDFPPGAHTHTWESVSGKPTTFPPSAHQHTIAEVEGLTAALEASTGGGETADTTFSSYATALSGVGGLPSSAQVVAAIVNETEVRWVRAADGTCLGGGWSPASVITPLHWGAVGDGIADDTSEVQAALNHLVKSTGSKPDAFNDSATQVVDGANRQYGISSSIFMGNVGNGAGMVYHAVVQNIKLVALTGDWISTVLAGIPKQMLVVAWRMSENYTDTGAGLFNIRFKNLTLDCRYRTGGIYLENTNSCTLRDSRIGRLGVNCKGYQTGAFKLYSGHPTGFVQGNGALLVDNLNIGGLEEEADEAFPDGFDQDTMGTVGMRHHSNDARINNTIISRVSQAADFDNCGAVQITNFHPWSKRVVLGPMATNFMFGDCYFDFTPVYVVGSFNHYFVACHWILGNASPGGHGLFLQATASGTTGAGLIVSGCSFRGDIGVNYITSGSGSWSAFPQVVLSGNKFDTATPDYKEIIGDGNFRITDAGVSEFIKDDRTAGRGLMAGNFVTVGAGRTAAGFAGFELQCAIGMAKTAEISQFASGILQISNALEQDIRLGNSGAGTGNALTIRPGGGISMNYLPTSATGLSSGSLWNSVGTLRIVP